LASYSTTNAKTRISYIKQNHQTGTVMPRNVSATKYVAEHQESPTPTSSNQYKREKGRYKDWFFQLNMPIKFMTRNLLISGSKEKEKRKVRKEPNSGRYSPLTEKNSWGRKNPDQIRPQFAQKLQNLQSQKEKAIFLLLTTPFLSLSFSVSFVYKRKISTRKPMNRIVMCRRFGIWRVNWR